MQCTEEVSGARVPAPLNSNRSTVHFSGHLCTFIDTYAHTWLDFFPLGLKPTNRPEFGRLRDIKQVGFLSRVYASASHSRWEHSLGTAHLAGMLIKGLRIRQPELGITDRDANCVQLAGLCHDLGTLITYNP